MRRWALLVLVIAVALIASCKYATQVDVVLRTNVPYVSGSGVAVWPSRSGAVGFPLVENADPWLADGEIGNVVVTPGDGSNESGLTVRIALGLRGKRAAECSDDGTLAGCIIARRKLSFVPHTRLKVPVVLYLACEGVKCSADTTCSYLGQCVPAQVDPAACATSDGCSLPGEPPFVSGVVANAGGDAGNEAGVDAAGDGAKLGGNDAGGGLAALLLTAGSNHTCATAGDGSIKCWGFNDTGQLGVGDTQTRGDAPGQMGAALPIVNLGPGRTAVQLSGGGGRTCAKLDEGSIKCWGSNVTYGALGLGDTQNRGDAPGQMGAALPAVNLGPGRSVLELFAGGSHACVRLDDGSLKCWGYNVQGQLGLGDTVARGTAPGQMGAALPAINLGPGRTAVQLSAGAFHTCARLDDGSVKCWGDGRLAGAGNNQNRGDAPGEMGAALSAVDLGPGRTAVQISAGNSHTCARLDDGSVKCWGFNLSGELGLGDTQNRGDEPGEMGAALPAINLGAGRAAAQLYSGANHACARLDDGSVKCWGSNFYGQLGLGDTLDRGVAPGQMGAALPAVNLGPGRTALQLSSGANHACARLDDGSIKCWGANFAGQLGLGDTQNRGDEPGEMGATLPAVQLK